MKPEAFRRHSTSTVHQNPWFRVLADEVERPGGIRGPFYWIDMKPGTSVLPITRTLEVRLIREYKYPLDRVSIEAVSGGIEPEETPQQAAERELREEAGLEAAVWTDLGRIDPFTTSMRGANHMFVATELRDVGQALEDGEQLEVVQLPFDEVVEMVMDGRIFHGTTCTLVLKAAEVLRRRGPAAFLIDAGDDLKPGGSEL